jgi:hypothetical protein
VGFQIIWGHEMMQRAIKAGHVTDFQLGGRSRYMYISAMLMKRVSYDLCRLMQTSAVIFDNDQTAAYDHMIPSRCMILSAREGVNKAAIETQLAVLRNCEYCQVKSAHGISPDSFQNDLDTLILGLLQGSAAVGAMWTLLYTLMFTVLDSRFPPTRFVTP